MAESKAATVKKAPVKAVAKAPAPKPEAAPAAKPEAAPAVAKSAPEPTPVRKPRAAKPVAPKVAAPAEAAVPAPIAPTPVVEAPAPAPVVSEPEPVLAAAPVEPAEPVIETVIETVTKTPELIESGAQTMTDQTKVVADQFQTAFGDIQTRTKAAMDKSAHAVEEIADLTKGNLEALMTSSKTAAKYVETLSQGAADYSRRSFEQASATFKSFGEVKSPADALKLQSDFARSAFDQWIAESAKVSETFMKMSNEIAEPLTSRYAVAAERVKALAA